MKTTAYTVQALAGLAGVSARTLRYYDQIGLLKPSRMAENGYRLYGVKEVDRLQQILFYREMDLPLEEIGRILREPDYDREQALREHLRVLTEEKERLDALIGNVRRTLGSLRGEYVMKDTEKFEGFKNEMLKNNEAKYGEELRARYGKETMDASNAHVRGLSQNEWDKGESLRLECEELLKSAANQGDPAGETAQAACAKHQAWIQSVWPAGMYTKEAHLSLVEGYTQDDRFRAYYDKIVTGGADFLLKAMRVYLA